jgi:hypothetical protein
VEPKAPLEVRPLWNPKSSAPQGTLSMWLDIFTLEEARKYPIKNITPPPAEDWEVRQRYLSVRAFWLQMMLIGCDWCRCG